MNVLSEFTKKQIFITPIIFVDIGLMITALLMFTTEYIVFFFHIIFVLLSIGAFFWNFRAFTLRSLFWVTGATSAVLFAVLQGRTQPDELIEIPLLTTILVMVFVIASFRAKTQRELEHEHQELKKALEERQALEEALLHQAFYDRLTGLPNRALLFDRLQHAFLEAVRHQQSLGLLFVDLDDFKSVNDRFGHAIGDQLLVEVSKRMLSVVRQEDTVARLGGDEFTVLVKDPRSLDIAMEVANRILEKISEPHQINGVDLSVSASIGLSISYPKGDQPEDLLREADDAMYRTKSSGKSKIGVHIHSL
ncbi:MAG TPA: GGDEF domain-containing protein [Anaerolineales bacterium]|nr:GGDEF domain-containing protein [Anaerolineales bacterium]